MTILTGCVSILGVVSNSEDSSGGERLPEADKTLHGSRFCIARSAASLARLINIDRICRAPTP